MIHGIPHDQFHLGIGDPGITSLSRTSRTGPSGMDILNRSVAERQGDDCFCFPRELLAIEISVHGGGVYQNRSVSELHGSTRFPQIPPGGRNRPIVPTETTFRE